MPLKGFLVNSLIIISIFFLTQCTSRYTQTSPKQEMLSQTYAKAKTSPISLQIPIGWREIDANDSTFIDLWLVSDDYKSSLSLIPLHSKNSDQSLDEWKTISKLSNKMKFRSDNVEINDEENIELNFNDISFYNFTTHTKYYRVAIFQFKEKYYELTALSNQKSENSNIVYIQNSVINTIR